MKKAEFLPFDPENWPRRSHFEHYRKSGCSFNLTAKVNIRSFLDTCRRTGVRSYPALAVLVTQTVNRIPEFRTAVDADGGRDTGSTSLPRCRFSMKRTTPFRASALPTTRTRAISMTR